ncbi:alpha/beta hydrolase [Aquabacterium sp. A7-Y]|uniref:alpha/beta fold hydrolase n=1 Tax=Aquabacterium sp. A7-Y TaxID=1349605 RepID=UPI00223C9ADA|nr:alpha/beta hydrolase [Aquabacterium sp. A7-Y]MCW7539657.1 alpha/beta hydrolase [Aquabacterium sp. A7-Y]
MTEPRLDFVQCLDTQGLHRMAYWEWGDPANPKVLVCAHGLSRQGRDFDALAHALCKDYRVVCPDVVGRGRSDWLGDPMGYQIPAYVGDMVTLLARLNAKTLDWVGTSMGGLIGLCLASLPGSPVRQLVLNDVGPTIETQAIERIGTYVGKTPKFASLDEAADYLWSISTGFGEHSREQWLALTRPMLRSVEAEQGGGFLPHYDPRIAVPFHAATPESTAQAQAQLWQRYDAVRARTLVLRGAHSDLLTPETLQEMSRRGPKAAVHEFPAVGHAPTLVTPEQIAVVQEFLLAEA